MRPLALALALAGPLAAAAVETPTTGNILFDGTSTEISYINIATCSGTPNAVRSDSMTVDLTWALSFSGSDVTWGAGGTYYLYVTNQPPDTSSVSCTASSTSGTFDSKPVGANAGLITMSGSDLNPMVSSVPVSRQAIASAQQLLKGVATPCLSGSGIEGTVYLCVEWFPRNSSTLSGRATGNMTIDLTAPTDAPTNVQAGAGDGRLHVSWTGVSDADRYKAIAVAQSGDTTSHGSTEDSSTSTTIDGLTNNVTYDVSVYALDAAGNPGPAGTGTGMPEPVNDFWEQYKKAGGKETGGCSTGAAGALALLAAAAALRGTRRRKP